MAPEYGNILRNFCQANKKEFKVDELLEGPKYDETWTQIIFIDGTEAGRGTGKTKRSAREEAAKVALEAYGWLTGRGSPTASAPQPLPGHAT